MLQKPEPMVVLRLGRECWHTFCTSNFPAFIMHSRRGHSIANAVHFGKEYREEACQSIGKKLKNFSNSTCNFQKSLALALDIFYLSTYVIK